MKKVILGLFFVLGLAATSHAWEMTKEDDLVVHSSFTVNALITTTTIVVALSSNTYPHQYQGFINITGVDFEFDKLAASSCTARLGVVTFVNTSTGSVTWFKDFNQNQNVSNTNERQFLDFTTRPIRCKVNPGVNIILTPEGLTPYIISNEKTFGSTLFQTDVPLPTIMGIPWAPAVGDIVLQVVNNDFGNGISVDYTVHYYSSRR